MSDAALATVAAAAQAAPAKAGKGRLIVVLAVVVVLLGGLGAGAWLFAPKLFGKTAEAAKPEKKEIVVKATVPLGAVVVNLSGEARRYVRVGVSVGVPDAHDAKHVDEHKSQLLDLVISVFSTAAVDTLMSEEGRTQIKETLLGRMREELHLEKIGRVYFTEFVIQ